MEKVLFLIGLLPLVAVCLVFILKKKKYLLGISTLAVTVGIGVASVVLIKNAPKKVSEEKYNYLCEMNLAAGNYGTAAEYLERMYREYGDTESVLTAQLRLAVLEGNEKDIRLAGKEITAAGDDNIGDKLTEAENAFVATVADGSYVSAAELEIQYALYESIVASVDNPAEYSVQQVSATELGQAENNEKKLLQDVRQALEESLENFGENRRTKKFVEAVDVAEKLQAELKEPAVSGEMGKEGSLNNLNRYLLTLAELYAKDETILNLPEVKEAFMNGCVRAGQYRKLVDYAEKEEDLEALSVLAYLYMTEVLDESDLEDFGSAINMDDVVERCEKTYERLVERDYSGSKLTLCEDYLDTIDAKNDEPVLTDIEARMADATERNGADASVLIQRAAINSVLADKQKVYENLTEALKCKDECANETVAELLGQIEDVVDNVAEDEEITYFSRYLEQSYKESLPLKTEYVMVPEEFLNVGNSYVNEKRAVVNVGLVKTEEFPVVKAYVSTSGIDLTKLDDLVINDCGIAVTDFKVEKVKYDGAQIILVCDNSGSMSGDVEELRSAVRKFINTRGKNEQIGIVTFVDTVLQNTGIGQSDVNLLNAVESFVADGGTNIASGVNAAFGEYITGKNTFNVMIVMTDGNDGSYNYHGALEELRATCLAKNVVMYTIGLGSVSAEYLMNLADSGMGSFVYSSNSAQLEDLYTFIHNQVEGNYLVTYTAVDTSTQKDRTVTISSESEDFTATRSYSLGYENDELVEKEDFVEVTDDICVTKLGTSSIVKSRDKNATYSFTVFGKGLDRAETISVSIKGNREYASLGAVVDSAEKMTVTLPGDVAYDTYEVLVNLNGTSYTLKNLKVLKEGKLQKLVFGDYIFEAYSVEDADGSYRLGGNVVMNDYLHFNGDIVLLGNTDGNTLVLEENSGSYISGSGILPGVLAQFFDNRIELPSLDGVTLYKQAEKYDKFYTHGKSYYGPLEISDPYIEVCPQYLNYTIVNFSFDYPILDNILEYADFETPFSISGAENKVILAKEKIGIVLNVEANVDFDKELELGGAELELDSFKLKVDTFNHNYGLGMEVELEDVPVLGNAESTYGFEVGIKSGRFDSFDLGADLDIDAVVLPSGLTLVTLSDFHAGVEGMAGENQDASFGTRLLGSTFYGQTDVNFFKLNQVIPGLDTFLGDILDISILKLDDTKLGLRISNFNMSLDTTAVLLETVKLGRVEADLGHYKYKNYLLDISEKEVAGVHIKASMDHKLDFGNNFEINVDGSGQIDVNKLFAGMMVNGDLNYNIKIFKRYTSDLEGNCLIGIHNKGKQFTVLIKGENHKKKDDAGVRLTFTKGNWLPEVKLY